jgi:hypothetical protein
MMNEIMSFAGKWMELEITMLSEISQAQKDKYHVFVRMRHLDLKIHIIRHDHKRGTVCGGGDQWMGGGRKERVVGGEYYRSTL